MSETRAGVSPRIPGLGGTGSHTKLIFVLPLVPGDIPTHVRITLRRVGTPNAPNASVIAFGGPGLAGASARSASAAVNARYPRRARTCTPGRLTRTLISWNFPSGLANVDV